MADSLFVIFGDHFAKHAAKNVMRQPLSNAENMGKSVSAGPYKPNEPAKKDTKKSFLSNKGMALESTPVRQAFTPRSVNVGALIYNDNGPESEKTIDLEEIEFTAPVYKYDNYHKDVFDYLPLPGERLGAPESPPRTPSPELPPHSMEFNCSYQDEFFTDDFSNDTIVVDDKDLELPDLY